MGPPRFHCAVHCASTALPTTLPPRFHCASKSTSSPTDLAHYMDPVNNSHAKMYPDFEKWIEATNVCFDNFERLGTFDYITKLPEGVRAVGTKLVHHLKKRWDAELKVWEIDKYRVRLVALGYDQTYEVNYGATYAPTAQLVTVRFVMNEVLQFNLSCNNMDVSSAFMNSDCQYDMWVRLPKGFDYKGHTVLKLNKTLEGTKQGAHDWYQTQHAFMKTHFSSLQVASLGSDTLVTLETSPSDACLYFMRQGDVRIYVLLHTDDYLVACRPHAFYQDFYLRYNKQFKSKDCGPISLFLGNTCKHDPQAGTFTIDQGGYIRQVAIEHGCVDSPTKSTPMAMNGDDLPFDAELDPLVPFHVLMGQLYWIYRNTRPDLGFPLAYHAQFTKCFTDVHYTSLKRVLLYLLHTIDQCLVYRIMPEDSYCPVISMHSDTDWAGNKSTRRSIMGNLGWINGNLVDWMCRFQKVVTLSTMEAEYIGYCSSARNGTHLAQLVQPFRTEPIGPVIIWGDNAAAKTFAEKDMINQKTKHIGIAYHYVREKVMEGFINIIHIFL